VVAATPALSGYPGGPGLPDAADSGVSAAAPGRGEAQGPGGPSVWQRAQQAWRDAGIEWQRPAAGWEPAEAGWERVQDGAAGGTAVRPGGGRWPARRAAWLAVIAVIAVVLAVLGLVVFG
jgi:hypothetical protein